MIALCDSSSKHAVMSASEHPAVVVARRGELVDLGDRVLGSPSGAEAVGDRLEVRLEDRFQDQLQGRLHQTVHRGGNPQHPQLARLPGLRDQMFPDR
jgi:hypothetical protein